MEPTITTADARMHVSLDTADLDAAVDFYRHLFGLEPAKRRGDWAKFELDLPPLVLALNAVPSPSPRGRLSHLGVRLPSAEVLADVRARLAGSGIATQEEPGTTCCYALQDKIWVEDPDGNAWEFYVLVADVDAATRNDATAERACCSEPLGERQPCC